MSRSRFVPMALVVLAATMASGVAQNSPYQPSCVETLKLNVGAFNETYTTRNDDQSEAGQDQAALYWADCKHKANLAALRAHPRARERLLRLRELENSLFSAETMLAYHKAGGGTMYPHARARFQPAVETHMTRVIGLVTTRAGAATSATIKARYDKALSTVRAHIARIKRPTRQDLEYTTHADWDSEARKYEAAWKGILAIANAPNAASLEIVEFVADGLWIGEVVAGN